LIENSIDEPVYDVIMIDMVWFGYL